jgi:hypothetical protein
LGGQSIKTVRHDSDFLSELFQYGVVNVLLMKLLDGDLLATTNSTINITKANTGKGKWGVKKGVVSRARTDDENGSGRVGGA